jgi:hypothetical protein
MPKAQLNLEKAFEEDLEYCLAKLRLSYKKNQQEEITVFVITYDQPEEMYLLGLEHAGQILKRKHFLHS